MSILIVDDDSEHRELLAQYLGDAGFDVQQACDGTDGVRKAFELLPEAAPVRAASTMLLVKPCSPDRVCALLRVLVAARATATGRSSAGH